MTVALQPGLWTAYNPSCNPSALPDTHVWAPPPGTLAAAPAAAGRSTAVTATATVRATAAVGATAAVRTTAVAVGAKATAVSRGAPPMAQKKKAASSAKKLRAAAKKRTRRAEECRGSLAHWHRDFLARTAEHLGCTRSEALAGGPESAAGSAHACSREEGEGVVEGGAFGGEEPALVELHSHSLCSDGTLSPTELVHRAAQRRVRVLALTDHDTFGGVAEAQKAGLEAGVAIIPGVEISTFLASEPGAKGAKPTRATGLHLLAYFPRRPSPDEGGPQRELLECLEGIRKARVRRVEGIVARCRKKGVQIAAEEVFEAMGASESASRNHVATVLVEKKAAAHIRDAFARFLGDDMIPHCSGAEVNVREAIQLVLAAGGVPVLAHPWSAQGQGTRSLLRTLQAMGLKGVEVYRGTRKMEDFAFVAKELGLLQLGGADYHARGAPGETEMGECPVLLPEAMKLLRLISTVESDDGEDDMEEV